MDAQELFRYLRDRTHRSGSTAEVDFENGRPVFKNPLTGEVLTDLPAAEAQLKAAGLTSRHDYSARPGSARFQTGARSSGFLSDFQSHLGSDYRVSYTTWGLNSANYDEFQSKFTNDQGRFLGFVIPDIKTTGMVRVENVRDKRFLTHEEIYGDMTNFVGMQAHGGGKVTKRLRGFVNPVPYSVSLSRPVEAFIIPDEDMGSATNGVIRRTYADHVTGSVSVPGMTSKEVSKHAFDGAVLVNPRMATDFANQQIKQAADLAKPFTRLDLDADYGDMLRTLRGLSPATLDDATVINNAIGHIEQAREIEASAKSGGVFNLRGYGINVGDSTVKGNFLWADPEYIEELKRETGTVYDIIGGASNFKREVEISPDRPYITADPREGSGVKRVYLDVDTMMTHHNFYDPDELIKANQAEFDKFMKGIASGKFPESLAEAMDKYIPDVLPSEAAANIAIQEKRGWLAHIAMMNKYGMPLSDNPILERQMFSSYREQLTKDGMPRLALPDAIRGEIIAESNFIKSVNARNRIRQGLSPLPRAGFIDQFNDVSVMRDADFARYAEALGGADQDDAVIQMLRWDVKQQKAKAIVFRQPTGIGEQAVLDVADDSEMIDTILRMKGTPEAEEILERRATARTQISKLERQLADDTMYDPRQIRSINQMVYNFRADMTRGLQHVITHHANTDEILARSVAYGRLDQSVQERIARNTGVAVGEGGMMDFFKINQDFERSVKEAQRALEATLKSRPYDSAFVADQLKLMTETSGQLGQYSNARMIAASFVQDNFDLMKQVNFGDAAINIIKQETAIDAQINLQDLTTRGTLDEITASVYHSVGSMMAIARDQGIDLKIDARALKAKGGMIGPQNILEGLQEHGIERMDDFIEDGGRLGTLDNMWNDAMEGFNAEFGSYARGRRISDSVADFAFEQSDLDEADEALRYVQERMRMARELSGLGEAFDNVEMESILSSFDAGDRRAVLYRDAHRDILARFGQFADGGPEKFFNRFGAAMQLSDNYSGAVRSVFNKSFFDVSATTGVKTGTDMSMLTSGVTAHFRLRSAELGMTELDPELRMGYTAMTSIVGERVANGDIAASAGRFTHGYGGSARLDRLAQSAATAQEVSSGPIQRMTSLFDNNASEIRRLAEVPNIKKLGIGLLGLTAASFMYQGGKGRSIDDMEGPELLPGGSFYEPAPAHVASPESSYGTGFRGNSSMGTNYRIRVRSGGNTGNIADGLSSLTGSNVNATMYNKNSREADGSYESIASRY